MIDTLQDFEQSSGSLEPLEIPSIIPQDTMTGSIGGPGSSDSESSDKKKKRRLLLAAIILLLLGGILASILLWPNADNQAPGPVAITGEGLSASGQSLHINLNTFVDRGKSFNTSGPVLFKNQINTPAAFSVQDAAGNDVLVVDTTNRRVGINTANPAFPLDVVGDINSSTGLRVGGVLVCTAQGCTSSGGPQTINTTDFARLSGNQTFTGINHFTSGGNVFVGDGSGLTALNASSLTTGTLNDNRLSNNVALLNANQTFTGTNTFNSEIQAGAGINSTAYSINGIPGSTITCVPGEVLGQAVFSGGIITSGLCVTVAGGTTPDLQQVYDVSMPATIILNAANGPVSLQDAASPLGTNLFEVTDNGGATKYFAVTDFGVSVTGDINTTDLYEVGGVQISTANLSDGADIAKLSATQTFTGDNTFTGKVLSRNAVNSTSAFQIQNSAGQSILNADTTIPRITIGADTPTSLLVFTNNLGARFQSGIDANSAFGVSNSGGDTLFNISTLTNSVLIMTPSDSTTAFQVQNAAGNNLLSVDTVNGLAAVGAAGTQTGNLTFYNSGGAGSISLQGANPGAGTFAITLPAASGTVCLTSGNCAGVGGTGDILNNGNSFGAPVTIGTNDANSLNFETNNSTQVSIAVGGATTFKNSTNSTAAFQIQNSGAADTLFTADTTARGAGGGNLVKIGNSTGTDTNTTILVLDSSTGVSSNLAGLNGGLFYNTSTNHVNVIENGTVKEVCNKTDLACGSAAGATTLQAAYTASTGGTTPEIVLDATRAGLDIQDRSTSNGGSLAANLLTVRATAANDTTLGAALFGVNSTGQVLSQNSTNSTTAFQVQNAAGGSLINVNSTSASISLNGLNSGELGPWQTATNTLPAARREATSVVANGYVYEIGGFDGSSSQTNTVYYSKLNSDGSPSPWQTNTNVLPAARVDATSVTANGYVYEISGSGQPTVYYARLNADGSTGVWQTNANPIPAFRNRAASVVANGFVYVLGGFTGAGQRSVYYARLNADGSTGAWQTSANILPVENYSSGSAVANGYVYLVGGETGSGNVNQVYYAKLNSDGSTGVWTTNANNMPANRSELTSVVANGYLYAIGGCSGNCGTEQSSVVYAKLNADGSTGVWQTNVSPMPQTRWNHTSVIANGYVYAIGGISIGAAQDTIAYGSVSRVQIGSSLDLVGLQGGNLSDPGSLGVGTTGGSITAGNGIFVGALQVQGLGSFAQGLSANGNLTIGGSALFQNSANSTTAFQIQNAAGSTLFNANTTNGQIAITGTTSSYSDEFNGTSVDPKWTFTTSGTATVSEGSGELTITNGGGGTDQHDCYVTPTTCLRLLETPPTGDFTAETKLDTMPGNINQGLGILVWSDSNNFIRFELDGTGKAVAHMVIAGVGSADIIACQSAFSAPTYIRVTRSGDMWSLSESLDGFTYDGCGSFTQPLDLSVGGAGIGLTLINNSGSFASANFDYFRLDIPALAVSGSTVLRASSQSMILDAQDDAGSSVLSLTSQGQNWQLTSNTTATFRNGTDTSAAFQIQNSAGTNVLSVDTAGGNVLINGSNANFAGAWNSLGTTGFTANGESQSAVYNGYIYRVGGSLDGATSTDTVQYAKLNADGSIGSWTTQANTINGGTGLEDSVAVAANGYIYVVGGWTTTQTNNTYYAKINSDGTTGPFNTTATLATNLALTAAVAYKGYLYEIGGHNGSPSTNVQYAKINANGTLSPWTATSTGFIATLGGRAAVANGYIYYTGGQDVSNVSVNTVQYAAINADGTLGNWTTTNSLAQATAAHGTAIVNSYIYVYGGGTGSFAGTPIDNVQYAKLNPDGNTGTWIDDTAHPLPTNQAYNGFANYNGYLYSLGGYTTGSTPTDNIYSVSTNRLQLAGSLDLIGLTAGDSPADSGNSGSLTAGNTNVVGALNVQDQVNFGSTLSVRGDLSAGGNVLFQNAADSTTAFQVQNAAGLSLLAVDTSGRIITISGDTTTFANLTLTNAHFKSTQTTAPTIGTPTACATTPTASVTAGSTDSAGSFTITSGSGAQTATCQAVITFNKTYGAAPKSILLTGASTNASKETPAVTATTATTFTVVLPVTTVASTAYLFYYWVIE